MADFDPGDFCRERKVVDEVELLGFSPSAHPLDLYDLAGCVPSSELGQHIGKRICMAGWMITAKVVKTKTKQQYMKFLSMEDLSGTFEVVLFPQAYKRLASLTLTHGPFRIYGKVEYELGALSLNCYRLEVL